MGLDIMVVETLYRVVSNRHEWLFLLCPAYRLFPQYFSMLELEIYEFLIVRVLTIVPILYCFVR